MGKWEGWLLAGLIASGTIGFAVTASAEDDLQEFRRLNEKSEELHRKGHYAEAIPLAVRSLAILEKVLGPDHIDTAASLQKLALLYQNTGAYDKALPLVQRALAIQKKVFGKDHTVTAESLSQLAMVYQNTGAYNKALLLYQRSLSIWEKTLGKDHPDTAPNLNNLAMLYQDMGEYNKALPLVQRALAIREKALGKDHADTAESLSHLAMLYQDMGAYDKALPLVQRALAIYEKVQGPEHPDTAESLNNLAMLYQDIGAYDKALPLVQRALPIHEKAQGPEHTVTAWSLRNLAELYRTTREHDKAEPLFQRALAIREKALGSNHPGTAISLNDLALLYQDTGSYDKALPLFQRAVTIQEKALGKTHPDLTKSLINLAWLYWASNQAGTAQPLLERALGIEETNLSRLLLSGSLAQRRQYLQTLDMDALISFSLAVSTSTAQILGTTAVLQRKGRALDASADSLAVLRRHLGKAEQPLLEKLAKLTVQRSSLSLAGPGKQPVEAFRKWLTELGRQQEQLEVQLSARSAMFRTTARPVTLQQVQQAMAAEDVLIEWIRYRLFKPEGVGKDRWGESRYAASVIRRAGTPVIVDLGEAAGIEQAVADLQQQLRHSSGNPDESARALYQRLFGPLYGPVFSLGLPKRLLLSPDAVLNLIPFAALVDGEGHYLGQHIELGYLTSGRDLIRLSAPAAGRDGSAMMVIASPDYGEAKAAGGDSDRSPGSNRSMDFDRSGMHFGALPGTAGEAKLLKQLFHLDESRVLTEKAATEERFKQLHGPRVLHVATHGFFLKDQAQPFPGSRGEVQGPRLSGVVAAAGPVGENTLLRSGLALEGANNRISAGDEDGILTAAEMTGLDLQGTQLVTLSACETGAGDVAQGDGVYGLRRALVLAGARSQLVSLWKVDDKATWKLMDEYYRRLAGGEGRAQALRSAQGVLQSAPATAHPFYWAAFVAIGDWHPVSLQKR